MEYRLVRYKLFQPLCITESTWTLRLQSMQQNHSDTLAYTISYMILNLTYLPTVGSGLR
jgi:hypothetical protein